MNVTSPDSLCNCTTVDSAAAVTWPEHDLIAPSSSARPAPLPPSRAAGGGGRARHSQPASYLKETWELGNCPWLPGRRRRRGTLECPELCNHWSARKLNSTMGKCLLNATRDPVLAAGQAWGQTLGRFHLAQFLLPTSFLLPRTETWKHR